MDVMVLGSAEGGCTLFDMLLNKVLTRIPMKEVAKKLLSGSDHRRECSYPRAAQQLLGGGIDGVYE